MEELKNNILERLEVKNSRVGFKNVLDELSEVVLERLTFVKDDKVLERLVKDLRDLMENNINPNEELLLMMIEIIENREGLDNFSFYDIIFDRKMSAQEKVDCLKKALKATKGFQADYIYNIYAHKMIPYKDLASDIILNCKYEEHASAIYKMFSWIELEEEKEYMPVLLEVAKLMLKVDDRRVLKEIKEIAWDENLLNTGYTISVIKLIMKCKTYGQVISIFCLFEALEKDEVPYAIDACKYFLMTKDELILDNLCNYIGQSIKCKLPISLDNINLLLNARKNFNGKYATMALTNDTFIEAKDNETMAGVYSDSRKEYHADLIHDELVGTLKPELLVGASMIVNEAENKKKALTITNTLKNLKTFDEINEDSLAFAALINRVYTNVEINLIANLAKNVVLNRIGVALPLARLIALEEEEFDEFMIWQAYQNEETKNSLLFGLASLYKLTLPEHLKKTEKIINNILKDIINTTIIYEEEKEPDLSIANKNLRKILEKRDKNAKR